MRCIAACFVVAVCLVVTAAALPAPPKVKAANRSVVAGLSSGAFAAVQYHVSWSSTVVGAGVIAGGPFYCAQGSETTALTACMYVPEEIDVGTLVNAAQACASGNVCDDLNNLKNQTVWLFSGSNDHIVNTGVVQKAIDFYGNLMDKSRVVSVISEVPAGHGWPTTSYGNDCATETEPFINNCNYDASFKMLSTILGNLSDPGHTRLESFFEFPQQPYVPSQADPASISMGPNAYIYIPESCQTTPGCTVVIALHGCEQTVDDIGTEFVEHTGLNEVAHTNRLIVLYPQVIREGSFCMGSSKRVNNTLGDADITNPCGCWDWWGQSYTGSNYSNQNGPQMATIKNMFDALVAGSL